MPLSEPDQRPFSIRASVGKGAIAFIFTKIWEGLFFVLLMRQTSRSPVNYNLF